jgi:hypothetical protein
MSDIFESPDGGKTVYKRLPGTRQRELYSDMTSDGRSLREQLQENRMWDQIRRMSRTDEGLRDLLERAIVYYNLKKDHG